MKKINDYKEVSPLILKYFKRGVITNNFLTVDDYKAEIEEERLFFIQSEDFLNIYLKRDGFYQLYFHALSENVKFPDENEKIICEVSGINDEILKKNGFSEIMKRVQLQKRNEISESELCSAKINDSERIYELIIESFDKYTGYIPCFSQIKEECKNGMIYKYEYDGKIVGILRSGITGKTSHIKHLCVDNDFRGQGIGKKLCDEFLKRNSKVCVWTGKHNKAALSLYKSLGFLENNIESTIYLKG